MRQFALIALVTVAFVSAVDAQYRYVDDRGIAHWVQSPNQIPPQYREKAEQPKLPQVDAFTGEDPKTKARRNAIGVENERQQRQRERGQAVETERRA
jgi:hypothetical protein